MTHQNKMKIFYCSLFVRLNNLELGIYVCLLCLLSATSAVFTDVPNATESHVTEDFFPRARIDAFKIASPMKDPYAVMVAAKDDMDSNIICSGTLLTLEWVLTAAHCFYDEEEDRLSELWVYGGGMNGGEMLKDRIPRHGQVRKTAKSCLHPEYKHTSHAYDLALIKLQTPFEQSDFIKTITFATHASPRELLEACKVTGFGVVQLNAESTKDNWRKTQHLLMSKLCPCEPLLENMFSHTTVQSWMCNRPKEDYGLCPGDSGGGLVCDGEIKGVASLIVVAKDIDTCKFITDDDGQELLCGTKDTLSIFTDIGRHAEWVRSLVVHNNDTVLTEQCLSVSNHSLSLSVMPLVLFFLIHLLIS